MRTEEVRIYNKRKIKVCRIMGGKNLGQDAFRLQIRDMVENILSSMNLKKKSEVSKDFLTRWFWSIRKSDDDWARWRWREWEWLQNRHERLTTTRSMTAEKKFFILSRWWNSSLRRSLQFVKRPRCKSQGRWRYKERRLMCFFWKVVCLSSSCVSFFS